ncbi:unnamed protein product [Schistocephalus solidus]|uniref:Uncharacterized protein n=1 Tax=Schistocephalus solidus TaxID=70667 RepID=A0A183TIS3_SCHSO|nr:unnamed protein product [Schistocephalus solidus]
MLLAVQLLKPFVDHRDEELLSSRTQKLQLAGAVPIPGMTGVTNFSAASPRKATFDVDGAGGRCAPNDSIDGSLPPTNAVIVHTIHRSPPTVYSECYEDKDGKIVKKTTKHTQVITTKTFHERYVAPPEALERAIQMTTRLDPDVFVVTSRVGSDHSHHLPSSNTRRTNNPSGNTRNPAAYISS